jgi:hypothetical protein
MMTLFDEYPAPDQPPPKTTVCCETWMAFCEERQAHGAEVSGPWKLVHALSHGRVPFTLSAFAEIAGTTGFAALTVIEAAVEAGWINHAATEVRGDQTELFVGALPRRR